MQAKGGKFKLRYYICSRRLTTDVFVLGLSSRARAPSFCTIYEYLRSGQRGALAAVCTPTIKSASEKHQKGDTSSYQNTMNGCSKGGQITQ